MASLFDSPKVRDWVARAESVPVLEAYNLLGRRERLKRAGSEQVGPCPNCGGSDRFALSPRKNRWNCRGWGGGGPVRLLMHCDGLGFLEAAERLTGEPCPNGRGARDLTPEQQRERAIADARWRGRREGREACDLAEPGQVVRSGEPPEDFGSDAGLISAWATGFVEAVKREREADAFREQERRRAFEIYMAGGPCLPGGAVARYLAHRGLELPDGARLREHPGLAYWHEDESGRARVIWTGPAMLAPLIRPDGRFSGVHMTWIDPALATRNGRPGLSQAGEALPTKKFRGSARAAYLHLAGPAESPGALAMGEGIETTLSVRQAMLAAGRSIEGWAFRAAGSLGAIGGPAAATLPHPTMTDKAGRARRVEGAVPRLTAPAIRMPDSVTRLLLLGDGDSDPFATRLALERAAARHRAPGRTIQIAMAPEGLDFNDWWRAEAETARAGEDA